MDTGITWHRRENCKCPYKSATQPQAKLELRRRASRRCRNGAQQMTNERIRGVPAGKGDLQLAAPAMRPDRRPAPYVTGSHDRATCGVEYVVADPLTRRCAVIDPILDFDPRSGSMRTASADQLLRHIEVNELTLEWILDTHPHADHFSAAGYLKDRTGASTAIGERVVEVQRLWK